MPQDIWDIHTLGSDGTNLPNGRGTMDINICEGGSVLQLKYQLSVSELQQILVALATIGLKATSSHRILLGTNLSMTLSPECSESSSPPNSPTTKFSYPVTQGMPEDYVALLATLWCAPGSMETGL